MDRNKLTSSKSIRTFLESVIQDSLNNVKKSKLQQKAIDEKDKQQSLASAAGGGSEDDDSLESALDGSDMGDDEEASDDLSGDDQNNDEEQPNHDKEAMQKGDVSFDDVVDKINTIRSGKSFKDSAIKSAMQKYVEDLKAPEKTALFAFLKGIAQIVTGEIPGDTATEPSEDPSSIEMKKDKVASPTQKKSIKPNVIKGSSNSSQAAPSKHAGKSSGVEDTSGPVIVPKRRNG